MPIRAPVATRSQIFLGCLDKLRDEYPEIDSAVVALEETLCLEYSIPHLPVDPATFGPFVHAARMDYPPLGAHGEGRFVVTYHRSATVPSMQQPYRTYTMLTIEERRVSDDSQASLWPNT